MIVVYFILFIIALLLIIPKILKLLGLHPQYQNKKYDLQGKRALIIATSTQRLYPTNKKTGVYSSELTIPYYVFTDANINVDLCSIKGENISVEPLSTKYPLITKSDIRFFRDLDAVSKLSKAISISDVEILDYDIIFMSGGFGAAYDLGTSQVLGDKLTIAFENGILLGSVCHGSLGFRLAKDQDKPLVEGKNFTGVTNKQIKELGVTITPLHPETELKRQNAIYHSQTRFMDVFANLVVEDGNIVTGQNQNSGMETASRLVEKLAIKTK